jgi:hypothetical protein
VDPGCKNKHKEDCKKKVAVHSIEQFIFMIPHTRAVNRECIDQEALRLAVVNFYHWYLQNQSRISDGLSQDNKAKDLIPPFNISWLTLHEYFEFIQKKYPEWVTGLCADPSSHQSAEGEPGYDTPGKPTARALETIGSSPDGLNAVNHLNLPNLAK